MEDTGLKACAVCNVISQCYFCQKMAESKNEVFGPSSNRLKDYKQSAKEPAEVKSTRKLIEGINLRRNQREKKVRYQ